MKLARHTLLNLLGLGGPLVLALVAIPALLDGLGTHRFGLLTLIWAVTSYFGLFDLGLGRALTLRLALVLERRRSTEVGPLCATALAALMSLGLLGGVLLAAAALLGTRWVEGESQRHDVLLSTLLLATALPAVTLTSGFRGILEARGRFDLVNAIRLPLGLWTFAGPWLAMDWSGPDLMPITASLAVGRWIALIVHALLVWRDLPVTRGDRRWNAALLRPLLTSGGWMTVSNVISPFMGYVDRFLVAALLSASAVTYYATPLEVVIKLSIIPAALSTVLFPWLAGSLLRDQRASWQACERALVWLAVAMAATAVPLGLHAPQFLGWWVGDEIAAGSSFVMQLFCIGIAINSLAHVPLTLLQSGDAARLPALLHCIELPIFLAALWLLTSRFGLEGAALAWLLRMVADTLLLFAACLRHFGRGSLSMLSPRLALALIGLGLGFAAMVAVPVLAGAMLLSMFALCVVVVWPDLYRSLRTGGVLR